MTDPRPILHDDPSLAERLLLASAELDRPPPGGKARMLVALGIGASVATVSAPSSAAAAAPSLIVKWLATGALGGLVVASSVAVVAHQVTRPRHEAPASSSAPVAIALPAPPRVSAPAPAVPAREPAVPVRETRPTSRTPAKSVAPSRGLTAEIDALDGARRALAAGDTTLALRLLDAHDADFPTPSLSEEATVLRVEALRAAGRNADAARIGRALLAVDPESAHAKRIRSILATLPVAR